MNSKGVFAVALVLAAGGWACAEKEFEPPDRAAQVAEAEALFSSELFDTVTWSADSARAFEGNVVYASSCRDCHGTLGEAGTRYALERELDVPSLVGADWRLANEPDSIRYHVFIGHTVGMPTWGIAGLTPREIDAVTHYLLDVLRPEMLEGG